MGQSTSQEDFEWKHDLEPHRSRRALMLKQYPQIKKLFVVDTSFKWKVSGLVLFQFLSLYMFRELPWWAVFVLAYALGGTINHSLMLAMHESSHMHAFGYSYPMLNRWFGIWATLPVGIPCACAFKKYHDLHHRFLGQDGVDTDLPTEWEGRVFRRPLMKALWLVFQPIAYGLRPFFVSPLPVSALEVVNIVVQLAFDALVYQLAGLKMLVYLIAGSCLAMGLHPLAGHFITEHFLWPRFEAQRRGEAGRAGSASKEGKEGKEGKKGSRADGAEDASVSQIDALRRLQTAEGNETFSYYGPLNMISWNVGYHVAHHDFPAIPGSLLPEVHRIAPEWYEHVPSHASWPWALVEFIMDPELGPFRRIKRDAAASAALLSQAPLGEERPGL